MNNFLEKDKTLLFKNAANRSILSFLNRRKKKLKIAFSRKIIIGAASSGQHGWASTNIHLLNVLDRHDFLRYWQLGSRQAFLAEHVWEHLLEDEARQANENCFNFLKYGGHLRIAVPDGFHPDPSYIEAVRPGGIGYGSDDHKILYNYKSLSKSLRKVGFEVNLLEYWDENHRFHFYPWDSRDGHINRSKRFDPRNQNGTLTYTSLIVDAIKP
jgi:predicted SAM-dependent methyltransferase